MEKLREIRQAIKSYKEKNNKEHERLIISKEFYDQLHEEAAQSGTKNPFKQVRSTIIDFQNMEIKENVDFNFKLLP